MIITRAGVGVFSIGLMVLGQGLVSGQGVTTGSGQAYPNKPIRVVTVEPGGGSDLIARLIAQGIAGPFGQSVIVENRGGASGIFVAQSLTKSPPDGYTMSLSSGSAWLLPFLQDNVPYDPVKDFAPVTFTTRMPNVLVVHPSLPVKSVKELIILGKAKPGALSYATSSIGSSTHLSPELFKSMAGVDILMIPYKSSARALTDLMSGQVQLMFVTSGTVAPHLKSGRMKALAVTSAQPSPLFPDLPTVAATGLPGYESVASHGVFVRANTPESIIKRLNQEIVRVLKSAEVKEKLFSVGIDVVGSSSEEFATVIRSDMTKWGKLIKDAGIRAE